MPSHPSYSDKASHYSSSHQPQPEYEPDDYKAHYDDLIAEYAEPYPYAATSKPHQTFNVAVPVSPTHRRGSSNPMAAKPSLAGKSIDFEDASDATHSAYPPTTPLNPQDTAPRQFWQKILPDSIACRLYLITVLVETTIDLLIEGELAVRVRSSVNSSGAGDDKDQASRKMSVYLAIFAIAHVFQFGMAVDAVYARNTLQFLALTAFNALFLVYAVLQINEIGSLILEGSVSSGVTTIPVGVLSVLMPVVIGVSELAYIALGWKIYHEFGWKVYKFLGADRRVKKMYANYQIFECLIKFDVFFWVGFSVQFIWLVLQDTDWEYYVTCAALPLSLVLLVEGHLAARHENKWMMITFMAGCVGAMVYFIYKLAKVLINRNTQYRFVFKSLFLFSVFAIILLLVTFTVAITVMNNFGRGLKASFARQATIKKHGKTASQFPTGLTPSANNPNRMSID